MSKAAQHGRCHMNIVHFHNNTFPILTAAQVPKHVAQQWQAASKRAQGSGEASGPELGRVRVVKDAAQVHACLVSIAQVLEPFARCWHEQKPVRTPFTPSPLAEHPSCSGA